MVRAGHISTPTLFDDSTALANNLLAVHRCAESSSRSTSSASRPGVGSLRPVPPPAPRQLVIARPASLPQCYQAPVGQRDRARDLLRNPSHVAVSDKLGHTSAGTSPLSTATLTVSIWSATWPPRSPSDAVPNDAEYGCPYWVRDDLGDRRNKTNYGRVPVGSGCASGLPGLVAVEVPTRARSLRTRGRVPYSARSTCAASR
jgi:hypothetical protein